MVRDNDVNPSNLHEAGKQQRKYSGEQLVKLLPPEGLQVTKWKTTAKRELGMVGSTFYDYLPIAKELAFQRGDLWLKKAS